MKKSPIILCTRASVSNDGIERLVVNKVYANAIEKSGGILLMLTSNITADTLPSLLEHVDGILIPGGSDLNPSLYNETKKEYTGKSDDERDQMELLVIDQAIKMKLPILAICRGLQILNVKFGGSLYQDIDQELRGTVRHDRHDIPRSTLTHPVSINTDSILYTVLGKSDIEVNSLHHQGIKSLGEGLSVVATAPDNLIEAVEMKDYPYLVGLQWHPEELSSDPAWTKFFDDFIQKCLD